MLGQLLQPEIRELIAKRDFTTLREALDDCSPIELADIIVALEQAEQAVVFRILPREIAADAFEYLDFPIQEQVILGLGQEHVAEILNEMSPDDRTAFLEELPAVAARRLLSLLSPEERAISYVLLGYPEHSVGRLMTPDYLSLKSDWNLSQTLEYIRNHGDKSETIETLYVLSKGGSFIREIRVRELLLMPPNSTVGECGNDAPPILHPSDDQSRAVELFRKYDRTVLPVIDTNGIMLGIVTVDDVLDIAEEEATEDIQKLGGLEALDEPYLTMRFRSMVRKRVSWLIVLFVGEMFTATAMSYFEDEISRAVVLALFVPLIISSGGNSGSQAATLVVRAIALGEITPASWWLVMRREIGAGLVLGMSLGFIGFLRISAWSFLFPNTYGEHWIALGITIWSSLVFVVLFGTLAGSMLPIILKKLGVDPAASSAPFVATLVDVTGLIIYFSTAALILTGYYL